MMDWGWHGLGMGASELLFGLLFFAVQVLFIAGVILLIARLVRGSAGSVGGPEGAGMQILEERYARGEITRDEFLERRAVLRGQ